MRVAALVLAAGQSTRFGSPKAIALLDGRPVLQHVLDAVRVVDGVTATLVVLGHAADLVEHAIEWRDEVRLRNPDPARGLSSSLRDGVAELDAAVPPIDTIVILLGDQPLVRPAVIRALLAAAGATDRPIVAPRYAAGGGANPLLLRRAGFGLVREAEGDRGLGPLLDARPELVRWVDVEGSIGDVDTPTDLVEIAWADRVRRNREQVDRLREVPDGPDFYAPVTSLFRADPDRRDDPVLDRLREIARPDETWLDIGAGAGRYALALGRVVGEVVALDPSPGMLAALREGAATNHISNVRPIEGRWPPSEALRTTLGPDPVADVALIAHVGYDVEAIGPFLEAMERTARRLCVAVLMERPPAAVAEPFWPPVHGEARVTLPALPEFTALLRARGTSPGVRTVEQQARRFDSPEELEGFLRRQLWIADGGEKERRFRAALPRLVVREDDGRFGLEGQDSLAVGVVEWEPGRGP